MNDQSDFEDAIAEIRLEFSASLPGRLRVMREAREVLSVGYDQASAETFFLQAHSLKGTAGAFEAKELEAHASVIADIARAWRNSQSIGDGDVARAGEELERLAQAVERYRQEVEGGEKAE